MKNPRMTREELERLLHTREMEIVELNNTISRMREYLEMQNEIYKAEDKKFCEGYQEAINKVCGVLVEIFGKEKKE